MMANFKSDKQRKAVMASLNKNNSSNPISDMKKVKEEKWSKKLSYKGESNETNVRELELYTENDSIDANLDKKKQKGTYTREGAEVAYLNLVENASRKYDKEFSSPNARTFSKADKVQVAKNLAKYHEEEYNTTN